MKFRDYSVKTRLIFFLSVVLGCMLIMAAHSWYAQKRSTEQLQAEFKVSDSIESAVDLSRKAQVAFKIQVQEWKDLLIRGGNPEDFAKYSKAFDSSSQTVAEDLQKVAPIMKELHMDSQIVDKAIAEHEQLNKKYREALKLYDAKDVQRAQVVDKAVRGIDRDLTELIDTIVKSIREQGDKVQTESVAAVVQENQSLMVWRIALAATFTAFLVIFGWLTTTSIVGPLQIATAFAQRVAKGDLTAAIDATGKDETGQLMNALKQMNDSLASLVSEVRMSAEAVTTASTQIASGNADLSSRTEEQASSLEETAASIEELTSTVNQNAESAKNADQLATTASEVANRGGSVVERVVKTMDEIQGSSKKISEIISVIDGIAFQTNILALNAAVEAARAGEQGRGFAVVASEVRSLAQRSASAAKEIKGLITDSVETIGAGSRLVDEAGKTMQDVVSSVKRVSDIISEIANATSEQSSGIGQVNVAVGELDRVTQQNAALVEQSAAASESLKQHAFRLAGAVSVFSVDDRTIASLPHTTNPQLRDPTTAKALAGPTRAAARAAPKIKSPHASPVGKPTEEDEWKEF
jgi:methyl-accepting chemotaxis protein